MLRLALAWLHLVALAIGFGAVYSRGRSLAQRPLTIHDVQRAFIADSWWGVAAGLWLVTGLWRLFGSVEKPASYYQHNYIFVVKMAMFVVILALEAWPMITLIKWRTAVNKSTDPLRPPERTASAISRISYIEATIILLIVLAAVAMARGYGARAS